MRSLGGSRSGGRKESGNRPCDLEKRSANHEDDGDDQVELPVESEDVVVGGSVQSKLKPMQQGGNVPLKEKVMSLELERERSNMLKGLGGVIWNLQCLLRYPYTNSHRDSFFASVEEDELRKAASHDTWEEGTANISNSKVLLSQINDAITLLQPLQERLLHAETERKELRIRVAQQEKDHRIELMELKQVVRKHTDELWLKEKEMTRLQQQVEALESEVQEAHKVAQAHDSLSQIPVSSPVHARSSVIAPATTEATAIDATTRCPSPESQSTLAASSSSLLSVREKLRKKRENESRLLQRFHGAHGQALQPPEPQPQTAQPQGQSQPQQQLHQPQPQKKLQPVAISTDRGQPSKDPALEWRFRLLGMQLGSNVTTATSTTTGHYDTESCTLSTSSSGGSLSEPQGGEESKCSDTESSSPHRRPLSFSPSRSNLRGGRRRAPNGYSVSFQSVEVRTYQQTLGDNPSVTFGLPICLDWSFEVEAPIPIDMYETTLSQSDQGNHSVHPSSSTDHLFLSSLIRHRILKNQGFTDLELDRVSQQLATERQERLERAASLQEDSMPSVPQESAWYDTLQTATRLESTKHRTTDVFHGDRATNALYISSRDPHHPHSTTEPMIESQFVAIVR